MSFKYIGENYTYKDPISNKEIVFENEKEYNVNFAYSGPQIVINGRPMIDPNGTIWGEFQEQGIRVPYAPELLKNFWLNPPIFS